MGTPKTLFDTAVNTHSPARCAPRTNKAAAGAARDAIKTETLEDNTSNEVVELALRQMLTQLIPRRILAQAKHYLRRECRKPKEMKVKIYLQHRIHYNLLVTTKVLRMTRCLTSCSTALRSPGKRKWTNRGLIHCSIKRGCLWVNGQLEPRAHNIIFVKLKR